MVKIQSRSFPGTYGQAVEEGVRTRVDMLRKLPLDTYQLKIIEPAISDSARTYFLRHWPPGIAKVPRRHPILTSIPTLIAVYIIVNVVRSLQPPSLLGIDAENFSVVYIVGLGLLLIFGQINGRLRYSAWSFAIKVIETSLLIAATVRYTQIGSSVWNISLTLRDTLARHHLGPILLRAEVVKAIHVSLWYLAAFYTIILIRACWWFMFSTMYATFTDNDLPWSTRYPTYYSAVLIQGILDSADIISRATKDRAYFNKHYSGYGRSQLDWRLRNLTHVALGPWARQMRRNYGIAGQDLASHSRVIALTMNVWRIRVAIASGKLQETLNEMCDALFKAATGDWQLITSRYKPIEHVGAKRALLFMRRLISAVISVGIVLVAYVFFSHKIAAFYLQAIAIACFGFAAAQLFTVIDPNSSTAFDTASRISEIFRRTP